MEWGEDSRKSQGDVLHQLEQSRNQIDILVAQNNALRHENHSVKEEMFDLKMCMATNEAESMHDLKKELEALKSQMTFKDREMQELLRDSEDSKRKLEELSRHSEKRRRSSNSPVQSVPPPLEKRSDHLNIEYDRNKYNDKSQRKRGKTEWNSFMGEKPLNRELILEFCHDMSTTLSDIAECVQSLKLKSSYIQLLGSSSSSKDGEPKKELSNHPTNLRFRNRKTVHQYDCLSKPAPQDKIKSVEQLVDIPQSAMTKTLNLISEAKGSLQPLMQMASTGEMSNVKPLSAVDFLLYCLFDLSESISNHTLSSEEDNDIMESYVACLNAINQVLELFGFRVIKHTAPDGLPSVLPDDYTKYFNFKDNDKASSLRGFNWSLQSSLNLVTVGNEFRKKCLLPLIRSCQFGLEKKNSSICEKCCCILTTLLINSEKLLNHFAFHENEDCTTQACDRCFVDGVLSEALQPLLAIQRFDFEKCSLTMSFGAIFTFILCTKRIVQVHPDSSTEAAADGNSNSSNYASEEYVIEGGFATDSDPLTDWLVGLVPLSRRLSLLTAFGGLFCRSSKLCDLFLELQMTPIPNEEKAFARQSIKKNIYPLYELAIMAYHASSKPQLFHHQSVRKNDSGSNDSSDHDDSATAETLAMVTLKFFLVLLDMHGSKGAKCLLGSNIHAFRSFSASTKDSRSRMLLKYKSSNVVALSILKLFVRMCWDNVMKMDRAPAYCTDAGTSVYRMKVEVIRDCMKSVELIYKHICTVSRRKEKENEPRVVSLSDLAKLSNCSDIFANLLFRIDKHRVHHMVEIECFERVMCIYGEE